ncbi:hypothetical protein B0T17DRAFT_616761 [Bombardia bombarda]|uniref:2'-phosphotransferase n=1 Tax=Bombardia bombarda TaxID=252184 RepID=A0AA40C4A9_9PEZI|nr:hypothetical protein B0T17DRAFT_616761 [Bombardia bombarda]
MAAAVAAPFHAINEQLGGVLAPSDLVHNSPRHGRSRGMSFKGGKNGRSRGYSLIEERDVTVAKALMFVLKRTIEESEVDEDDKVDNLVADAEGWVAVDDALEHPKLAALDVSLEDIQRITSSAAKARFNLRQLPDTAAKAEDPASWAIRRVTNRNSLTAEAAPVPAGEKLSLTTADLPDFIVFETSYQRYPLLLASGAINQAPGGTPFLSFQPVTVSEDGSSESRQTGDVSIWIHLRTALEAAPEVAWQRTESGTIITSDEVPKSLWKKAVARKTEIGLLFEDGEVKKEVPAGLRGRGAKGKAKKDVGNVRKGALKREGSASEEESGSAEEADL